MSKYISKETGQEFYCYSPVPKEQYTTIMDGEAEGLGAHEAFNTGNPGVWNLFWISTDVPDDFLKNVKDNKTLPYTTEALPVIVATAYQLLSNNHAVGELAAVRSPAEWWEEVKGDANFENLLAYTHFGDAWVEFVERRIKEYSANNSAKIIPCNFGNNHLHRKLN